jgi:anti-sigma regulatory factor (Ser/Thr protein kinase)
MCDLTTDQSRSFPSSTRSPSAARRFVDGHCCPGHGDLAKDALLLITSELVTNAVFYGKPPITVQLSCLGTEIRLTVGDAGPGLPDEQGTSGRQGTGLRIVGGIAREWGTARSAGCNEVWCRVPTGVIPEQREPGIPAQPTKQRQESYTHQQ